MGTLRNEIRRIVALAAPVVVAQIGLMMLGVVDNAMLGSASVDALNASNLGRVWSIGTLLIGLGCVLGIDPLVSQAHGAGRGADAALALQRGLVVCALFSVPIAAAWIFTEELLVLAGQDPALSALAESYVLVQIPSIPAWLAFSAMRTYAQGRGLVRPAMWIAIAANLLNAFGNWLLIFGNLGFPKLGVAGAGISTAITQIAMAVALAHCLRAWGTHRESWKGWRRDALEARGLATVLSQGLPVAAMLALEIWAFHIATLLAGRLGQIELAAHSIVLNLCSLSFMVPLGISMGAAARVGNLIGAGDREGAQRAAWASFVLGAGTMSFFGLTFFVGRNFWPTLYTNDSDVAVRAFAAAILPIGAAFQIFDGMQVVGCGVLRGMGKPRPAAAFNLIGYYAIALPLGGWLAFRRDAGLQGLWWGLSVGLFTVAAACLIWISLRGPRHAGVLRVEGGGGAHG